MYAVAVVVVVYVGKILRYSSVLVSYDACQPAALVVVVGYFFSVGVFYGVYSAPDVVFSVCFQIDGVAAVRLHNGVAFMNDIAQAVVFPFLDAACVLYLDYSPACIAVCGAAVFVMAVVPISLAVCFACQLVVVVFVADVFALACFYVDDMSGRVVACLRNTLIRSVYVYYSADAVVFVGGGVPLGVGDCCRLA